MSLHYKDYGPKTPGTPAVLLLHGFNGSVFNWCGPLFLYNASCTACTASVGSCMHEGLFLLRWSLHYDCSVICDMYMHRRHVMEPLCRARASPEGCRVIAFDRPPFGLTERPLQWAGGEANNPYTAQVPACALACALACTMLRDGLNRLHRIE